nr:ORF6N domain-containing protein [Streptococcus equi]
MEVYFVAEQEREIKIVDDKTIKEKIYLIRGQRVMLDADLAEIYGYSTRAFNQQVRNNIEKFDADFMFRLDKTELEDLRSNFLTANVSPKSRALPYVFTEQGIYMLMTVLKGELAITQSKALIRTFKQMKDFIIENQDFIGSKELVQIAIQTNQNTNDIKQNSKEISELNSKMNTLATKEDLKKVMDNFIDPETYKHFLLMNGDKIEADVAYTKIYKSAKKSIYVIDNYIGLKTLELLRAARDKTQIIVFSDNVKNKDMLTKNILDDFRKDYPNIDLKLRIAGKKYHDRYIAIDYGTENEAFYLCGASSKDAGNKVSSITKIEESSKDMYHDMFSKMLNNKDLKI